MHTYCDAMGDRPGNHVVQYAAILYPGSSQTYHDTTGIAAISARPNQREALCQALREALIPAFT